MAIAVRFSNREPLGDINTTPLIDVMLVLLIMIIMTIPVARHSLQYDLPGEPCVTDCPDRVKNKIVITPGGALLWNGGAASEARLAGLLAQVRRMHPEPEVQFEPAASASYQRSAQVLQIVKASRVTRFGFVGSERYREFSRGS